MVFAAAVITALILINALYVGAEFAVVSVRRSRIRQLAATGNRFAAWLLPTLESPALLDRYIAACQIGITLASLVLGAYARPRSARPWRRRSNGSRDLPPPPPNPRPRRSCCSRSPRCR